MVISHVRERVLSAFSDLHFEERRHIYTLDGRILPSVSKLVESHVEKVDFEKILPHSAAKQTRERGIYVSPDELRKEWHTKRDDACYLGHRTHDFMEKYTGVQTPRTAHERAGVKFFIDMSWNYDILFREIRMYSRQFDYAGTEDLILIHKETGDIITADYKTNGDLFKNYKGKTLAEPFGWAEESPYNKYQLQLSYYQIMLEEIGLYVKDRWLVYFMPDATYKVYPLLDLTSDLRTHMKHKIAA